MLDQVTPRSRRRAARSSCAWETRSARRTWATRAIRPRRASTNGIYVVPAVTSIVGGESGSSTPAAGQPFTLVALVNVDAPGVATPTGSVTFSDDLRSSAPRRSRTRSPFRASLQRLSDLLRGDALDVARGIDENSHAGRHRCVYNCALISWIEGSRAAACRRPRYRRSTELPRRAPRGAPDDAASALPEAAEACLTADALVEQVERRFARLAAVADRHAPLAALLHRSLLPALKRAGAALRDGYDAAGLKPAAPVAAVTLSPSDFGFHNSLKEARGRLVFIDFEYFGWDDPVKLVADTALHPRNDLPSAPRARLIAGMTAIYAADDPDFRRRLKLLTPLFGLRWCAILLNEFLPEKWAVRAHAGAAEREAAEMRQLAKAKALFETLSRDHEQLA